MKLLKRLLLGLALMGLAQGALAAIAFVASSVGPNNNGTGSGNLTLPTGFNSAGNITVAVFVFPSNPADTVAQPTVTPPSGWTVLLNSGGALVVYRLWQSGDASSISASSTASGWWESVADTYSGVDATTPIDNFASFAHTSNANFAIYRAPQLNPNFNNSMLLIGFTNNTSSGNGWSSPPAGFTARANTAPGPNVWTGEKSLTGGTATGDQTITGGANTLSHASFQLALKSSGASAATLATAYPYIAGVRDTGGSTFSTFTLSIDHLNVQNNDMVVFVVTGPGTWSGPGGYTKQITALGAQVFTHLWLTGDSVSPTFTSSGLYTGFGAYIVRSMGVSAGYTSVTVDQIVGAAATGTSPQTGTTSSLTPTGASELLLCFFGPSVSGGTVTWSAISGGLTQEINSSGLMLVTGHVLPAATPTGTFSATDTGSSGTFTNEAVAALFGLTGGGGGSAPARHKLLFN